MRIRQIETIAVRVPIRPEFQIRGSLGSHTESPFVILRIHTHEGIIGLGVGDEEVVGMQSGAVQERAVSLLKAWTWDVTITSAG